ncbi:hypothetical protein ACFXG6_33335 [Streptomyces roseus]|uniref:hypothetical protein n=1 Tax=Streptomyces roseus TaxID=66430 RepID=UPI00367B9FDD
MTTSTPPWPTPSRRPRALWHRHGTKTRPLTPEQQRSNCELLLRAQHTPRPRSPRTTDILAEAS